MPGNFLLLMSHFWGLQSKTFFPVFEILMQTLIWGCPASAQMGHPLSKRPELQSSWPIAKLAPACFAYAAALAMLALRAVKHLALEIHNCEKLRLNYLKWSFMAPT